MRRVQKILLGIFMGGVFVGGIGTGVALVEYSSLAYAGERRLGEEYLVTRELDYRFDPEEEEIQLVRSYWDEGEVEADETVPEGVIRYVITYNEKQIKPILNFEEDREQEEETEEAETSFAEKVPEEGALEQEAVEEIAIEEENSEGREPEEDNPEEGIFTEDPGEEENGMGAALGENPEEAGDQAVRGTGEKVKKDRKKTLLYLNVRYISSDFAIFMQCKDEILTELKNKRIFNYEMAYITDLKIKVNPQTMPLVHRDF